jgi:hypothetical protein
MVNAKDILDSPDVSLVTIFQVIHTMTMSQSITYYSKHTAHTICRSRQLHKQQPRPVINSYSLANKLLLLGDKLIIAYIDTHALCGAEGDMTYADDGRDVVDFRASRIACISAALADYKHHYCRESTRYGMIVM